MTYMSWRRLHAYGESVALRWLGERQHQPADTTTIYTDWCIHERQGRAHTTRRERAA